MPTLKLVLSIQTKDFKINNRIKFVLLISNPFPMICFVDLKNVVYLLDINGKLIRTIEIDEKADNILFCIDKNCGLFNDHITFIKNNKEIKITLIPDKL